MSRAQSQKFIDVGLCHDISWKKEKKVLRTQTLGVDVRAATPAVCRADLEPDLRNMFPQVIPQVSGQVRRLPAGRPGVRKCPARGAGAPRRPPPAGPNPGNLYSVSPPRRAHMMKFISADNRGFGRAGRRRCDELLCPVAVGMCAGCAGSLMNDWAGRFIISGLVQLRRKLIACRDRGGPRANTCLLHHKLMALNKEVDSVHILPI